MDITIKIPDHTIADALALAYASGVSYWCDRIRALSGSAPPLAPNGMSEAKRRQYWPVFEGKWILHDMVTRNTVPFTHLSLSRGLTVIVYDYPTTLTELMSARVTKETGDVLVQCSVFGKLVYWPVTDGEGRVVAGTICADCKLAPPCACVRRAEATTRETLRP